MLKWLADELTACEAKGQRAWIIGHVLSGYDGSQPLPNPTALFYSIVRRFSPTTIAGKSLFAWIEVSTSHLIFRELTNTFRYLFRPHPRRSTRDLLRLPAKFYLRRERSHPPQHYNGRLFQTTSNGFHWTQHHTSHRPQRWLPIVSS